MQAFVGELMERWMHCMGGLPRIMEAPELVAITGPENAMQGLSSLRSLLGTHFVADLPGVLQEALQSAWQRAAAVQQVRKNPQGCACLRAIPLVHSPLHIE